MFLDASRIPQHKLKWQHMQWMWDCHSYLSTSQKSHAHVCIQQWTLKDTARLKKISTLGSTHWRWRESKLLHRHDCTLHQKLILHKVLTDKQFQLIPPRPSHVWLLEKLWSSGDKFLCWRLLVPVWVWFDMPTRKLKEWSAFTLRSGLIIEQLKASWKLHVDMFKNKLTRHHHNTNWPSHLWNTVSTRTEENFLPVTPVRCFLMRPFHISKLQLPGR